MSSVEKLIQLCNKVRQTKPGEYTACCPAHDDRSPSLAVRECDDGRVLVHCFAGCQIEDIVAALGLELADLMPDRPIGHRVRKAGSCISARDGLTVLGHETLVIGIIAADFFRNHSLDEETWDRLAKAIQRVQRVNEACGVQP